MTYRCQKSDVRWQKGFSRFLTSVLRLLISVYRYSLAFIFGGRCRFTPSCSAYAIEAIEAYGPWKGIRLAVGRICRCHPWGGHGHDPIQRTEDR